MAFHGVTRTATPGPVGFAAPAGAHLTYFGGPIISNVQVIQVLYGSGSYNAQVAGTTSPTMGNFFADITSTGLITLMQQYNTPVSGGTGQTFGNGTFAGLFQIVPAAGNNGSTITDAQIQSELLAQINAGHLPAPVLDAQGNPNTLYMTYFPPGKTISQGGSNSCQAGGFCAYHGTTSSLLNGQQRSLWRSARHAGRQRLLHGLRHIDSVRKLYVGYQPRAGRSHDGRRCRDRNRLRPAAGVV